jgi:hypothetical protein
MADQDVQNFLLLDGFNIRLYFPIQQVYVHLAGDDEAKQLQGTFDKALGSDFKVIGNKGKVQIARNVNNKRYYLAAPPKSLNNQVIMQSDPFDWTVTAVGHNNDGRIALSSNKRYLYIPDMNRHGNGAHRMLVTTNISDPRIQLIAAQPNANGVQLVDIKGLDIPTVTFGTPTATVADSIVLTNPSTAGEQTMTYSLSTSKQFTYTSQTTLAVEVNVEVSANIGVAEEKLSVKAGVENQFSTAEQDLIQHTYSANVNVPMGKKVRYMLAGTTTPTTWSFLVTGTIKGTTTPMTFGWVVEGPVSDQYHVTWEDAE